ncbi:hypothetical protein [Nonomuraea sp. NPDC023979]|uniref:hypothetical protein n=1 Tax=Nonomuraea sp. NPDC023979 TaxID=3154796 RepID=UPI0033D04D1A
MYSCIALHPSANPSDIPVATLGIEVTIPHLAEACSLGNIDPQHLGGDATTAAIEAAMTWPPPPPGTTLATVRADADSVGAMAVLTLRATNLHPSVARMQIIADADKEASGPWPGPRPAPAPEGLVGPATPVMHLASDYTRSLPDRVELLALWLMDAGEGDDELGEYAARALDEAREALADLQISLHGHVAVVVGSHRLAFALGYRHAPVVVATNPGFSFAGGPPHRKHTVARWNSATPAVDWHGLVDKLNAEDPAVTESARWGGSASIVGSPQGISSGLATEDVAVIVQHFVE